MKLAVSKNNEFIDTYDFTTEVQELESQEFSCFIGRADTCLIQLDDYKISREHAHLIFTKGTWFIKNISDVGMILVNGTPVDDKPLVHGDIISIGDYSLMANIPVVQPVVEQPIVAPVIEEPEEVEADVELPEEQPSTFDDSEGESEFEEASDNIEDELVEDLSPGEYGEDSANEYGNEYSDGESEYSDSNEFSDEPFDEYGDNSLDGEVDDSFDGGESTKVFSGFTKVYLELFGEDVPFEKFELPDGETLIGRDPEKCQILLNDSEVSGVHAKIKKTAVQCTIQDMDSSNGILLNGARIETGELTAGDEFIIGSTTFTYAVSSSFFKEESDSLMPVEENQIVEVEEIVEVDEDDPEFESLSFEEEGGGEVTASSGSLFSKDALKDPAKRKKIIYILAALVVLWVLLDDDSGTGKKKVVKKDAKKSHSLVKKDAKGKNKGKGKKKEVVLTPEQKEFVEATYQVAQQRLAENAYQEAVMELDKIFSITPNYKQAKTIYEVAKNGLAKLEELERKKQQEIDDKIRNAKVKKLVAKAQESVKKREVEVAKSLFNQILELDPENFDVPQMKIEIDAFVKEKERKELEKAQKEADRKRKLNDFAPAKSLYIQKQWNKAIIQLSHFLTIKDMDEDLTKEATEMLSKAKRNLDNIVSPMLGRARSLKEGQDLKGAYEVYKKILDFSPGNKEALKEMQDIKDKLTLRARRVYRKALIAESLSLFQEAKELYQEVQQISPSDSEYYIKATERLKNFWEN